MKGLAAMSQKTRPCWDWHLTILCVLTCCLQPKWQYQDGCNIVWYCNNILAILCNIVRIFWQYCVILWQYSVWWLPSCPKPKKSNINPDQEFSFQRWLVGVARWVSVGQTLGGWTTVARCAFSNSIKAFFLDWIGFLLDFLWEVVILSKKNII